ncbi:MAG TPA: UpxY family transcription antiterminator [Bacteroidales bacterium]|nr:UpxY family transcription antiterminator [Bacteroidales bacterium]HQK37452.1 UpxY family transcription antiterminator [Bacteroidales bacterium]
MSTTGKVWHALYTRPRWEKKVLKYLQEEGIEAFLPLRKSLKQWSDRKKWVEEPLFRSYVFVHILPSEYYKALNIVGAVRYVVFEGKAAVIPDRQIQMVKDLLALEVELEVTDETLLPGERVVIRYGPLKDVEGEMVEFRSKSVIALRIDHISGTILVSVPSNYVKRK